MMRGDEAPYMKMRKYLRLALWASLIPAIAAVAAQRPDPVVEPFKGVTTDGTVVNGLFPIRATGVTTAPVRDAAVKFIAALTPEQQTRRHFQSTIDEWRKWINAALLHAAGREFQGDDRRSARRGLSLY